MEKKQEKEKRLHEGISVSEERSHFRGKKSMDSYSIFFFVGTLPLPWEKDSVFMHISEVFAAICN